MRVCSVSVRSGKKIEKIETQFSDSVLFSCVKTSEYNTERNKFQVESKRNDRRKKRGKREEGKGIEEVWPPANLFRGGSLRYRKFAGDRHRHTGGIIFAIEINHGVRGAILRCTQLAVCRRCQSVINSGARRAVWK